MQLPDLNLIYKVMNWHRQSQDEHDNGGLFIVVPSEIAEQFPIDGKNDEDDSPPHITLLFLETLSESFEDKIKETVCQVCTSIKPFKVKLSRPKKFVNNKNQTIIHSPVKSKKLQDFHYILKKEFMKNHLPVSNKYPEFKPHISIEYVNEGEKSIYKKVKPQGEWIVDSVWLWGTREPYMILLGK